jgi:hypothetical protein
LTRQADHDVRKRAIAVTLLAAVPAIKMSRVYGGIMPGLLRIVFAAILTFIVSAAPAAEAIRVPNLDAFCEEVLSEISNKELRKVADLIANTTGQPDLSSTVTGAFQIFEGKNCDFTRKVIDKDFNGGLRQIVYYSYVEKAWICLFSIQLQDDKHWMGVGEFHVQGRNPGAVPKSFH